MSEWNEFLEEVHQHLEKLSDSGCDIPYFRGHSDCAWDLLCGLGRQPAKEFRKTHTESVLYYDFLSLGGTLLGRQANSWDILFSMQHHGLPTRILDWTTTFSAALYFALRPYIFLRHFPEPGVLPKQPCIWILDPFELNRSEQRDPAIANPYTDFNGTYQEFFLDKSREIDFRVAAIGPPQHTPRQSAQRSVFTLHSELYVPLDQLSSDCVRKFEIPVRAGQQAMSFLRLAGVNEFSVFPDLDGLSRHLKGEHVSWLSVTG